MTALGRLGGLLKERQRWVLLALLAVLHLTLISGAETAVSLMCWLVDVGLFILWQPFVHTERHLDSSALLWLLLILVGGAYLFGWWLLVIWVLLLTSLLGGRVLLLGHRPTRIFYLLAFAYLLCALFVWLLPKVVPDAALTGSALYSQFTWAAPLLFVAMLMLPRSRESHLLGGGNFDFFYSLFVFLLVSVLVLGCLAFMLLCHASYVEAVFKTLLSTAGMLLLIAWAWNPRPGFSGVGVFLSRYLLSVGMPFETWLQLLIERAQSESDPDQFLHLAMAGMLEMSWVTGGKWVQTTGAKYGSGSFGQESRFSHDFAHKPLVLTLFTRHKLSPALVWHFHLLTQLTNEYYLAKHRARELQQMSYLQAVHETGARLTHDVKNLLQSLNNLCFVAQSPDVADKEQLNLMLRKQLQQITQRLQQTLERLQEPQNPQNVTKGLICAQDWWDSVQQRYSSENIIFNPVTFQETARLPAALFDSVADNLLLNALQKGQSEMGLKVQVTLASDAQLLSVEDDGRQVSANVVGVLLRAPVSSENGLGIGLYHAAKQAEAYGYQLSLSSNVDGQIRFELKRSVAIDQQS